MTGRLDGKRVVVLLAEGFEDLEFHVPLMRLQEEGAEVTVAGITTDEVAGKHGLLASAETTVDAVDGSSYDAVVVPGGWAPDKLRRYDSVKDLVRGAHERGAIVGMICHAGWVGVSAGIVEGGARDRFGGHQGRSRERRRDVGRRARVPRREHRLGPGRRGHPRLLPRARRRDRSRLIAATAC